MFRKSTPFALIAVLAALALSPVCAPIASAVDKGDVPAVATENASADVVSEPVGLLDLISGFMLSIFEAPDGETSNAGGDEPWGRGPALEPTGTPNSN